MSIKDPNITKMFWKIKTKEYKELKHQLELIWIEIDILTARYKRKVKPPKTAEETEGYNDGFDEVRNINKGEKQL